MQPWHENQESPEKKKKPFFHILLGCIKNFVVVSTPIPKLVVIKAAYNSLDD